MTSGHNHHHESSCRSAGAVALTLTLLLSLNVFASETAATRPVELRPYRVLVNVSFADDVWLTPEKRRAVLAETREAVSRCVGEMWQIDTREDPTLSSNEAIFRLTESVARKRFAAEAFDKVFLLSIQSSGAGFRIAGREWDSAVARLTRAVQHDVLDDREVASGLLWALRETFRPVAQIETTLTGSLRLRGRAAALSPPDAEWGPLKSGTILEPYYRYFSATNEIEQIQPVPWTYLQVEIVKDGVANCQIMTGLRSPLTARRRRVEAVALAIGPLEPETRLTLATYAPRVRPQTGLEVDVAPGHEDQPRRLVSDRQGVVRIPVDPSRPLCRLDVRSGQSLLARVPFVAGLRAAETLELPDDALRLSVEGDISILQAELVDTVARRAVIAATARAEAKLANWKEVDALLKELAELPRPAVFAAELTGIRLPALQAARDRKDRAAEVRIQKLCDETSSLIARYLDADKLKIVQEEVEELRKADAETKAAVPKN